MQTYILIYLPTGRRIGEVQAKSALSAKRKFGWHNWELHLVTEA